MVREPRTVIERDATGEISGLADGFHPVVKRVLLGRGVRDAAELSLGLRDMAPPGELAGIGPASEMLADAVCDGQSILVVGDFDADGATGSALAILALRSMGAVNVDFRVPNRFEFGYGLTVPLVETLGDDPPTCC